MNTIFITGIGTGIGKTVASAVLTEALKADYWKPIQAGFDNGTDAQIIQQLISNNQTTIHKETYKFRLAASPHIAARAEGVVINLNKIEEEYLSFTDKENLSNNQQQPVIGYLSTVNLIIEGAGGLMVPLNENEFVIDLIKRLNAKVILVSRNYLGSINHSLLTAAVCKQNNINVLGWIFNDDYMSYENEIVRWSGYPKITALPFTSNINGAFVYKQASLIKDKLLSMLC